MVPATPDSWTNGLRYFGFNGISVHSVEIPQKFLSSVCSLFCSTENIRWQCWRRIGDLPTHRRRRIRSTTFQRRCRRIPLVMINISHRGLIHRWQPLLNDSSQELQLFNVLGLAKCNDLNCLRGLPSDQLQQVHIQSYISGYGEPGSAYGVFYYGPVVDGLFVIELPDQAFKHGRFYNVPLIVDRDGYEGVDFTNKSVSTQVQETTDAEILFPDAGRSSLHSPLTGRSVFLLSVVRILSRICLQLDVFPTADVVWRFYHQLYFPTK
jgi:hypothetical protein